MKLKDFTIYATPLWLGMLLEQQEERCQRELKMESKEYNEIPLFSIILTTAIFEE